jgi:ADP-ribose pyrophosphatase YjhB (NUDIX family)
MSKWLPDEIPSRLPFGPTHQVGVGTLVLNPRDPLQMLVVQEKTGPGMCTRVLDWKECIHSLQSTQRVLVGDCTQTASHLISSIICFHLQYINIAAVHKVWKMPTGLLDPGEDIPDAAIRELKEETGFDATMQGILCFRQAHSSSTAGTTGTATVRSSDLFFVCHMHLTDPNAQWSMQEEEIADIRWMTVDDYCNQELWLGSPVYDSLNQAIRQASANASLHKASTTTTTTTGVAAAAAYPSLKGMILHERLPVGFRAGTNALYKSQL